MKLRPCQSSRFKKTNPSVDLCKSLELKRRSIHQFKRCMEFKERHRTFQQDSKSFWCRIQIHNSHISKTGNPIKLFLTCTYVTIFAKNIYISKRKYISQKIYLSKKYISSKIYLSKKDISPKIYLSKKYISPTKYNSPKNIRSPKNNKNNLQICKKVFIIYQSVTILSYGRNLHRKANLTSPATRS